MGNGILPTLAHNRACPHRFDGFHAVQCFNRHRALGLTIFITRLRQFFQAGMYR